MLLAIALRTIIVFATTAKSESDVDEGHVAEDAKPDMTMVLCIPPFVNGKAFLL